MTSTTFSSAIDDDLLKIISDAQEVAGVKKAKPKPTGPRTFDYPDGYQPIMSVIPLAKCDLNIPIRVFNVEDWPESVRMFIPKVDKQYIFPVDATLAVCFELFSTLTRDKIGPMLLHGPKGSGKSSLFQQICARINMPFIRVNCKMDMESGAIFGMVKYDPSNGIGWVDGPLTELAKVGGFFCLDEASRIPSGIMDSMQYILERGGKVYLSDKPGESSDKFVEPNEWFRLGLTDNTELQGDTTGKYVSANVQDEAMVDRIATSYRLDYLDPAHEVGIITTKVASIDKLYATKMVQLAKMIRDSYDSGNISFTMSPRGLLEWAEKIERWQDERRAFKLSFYNKLTKTDQAVVGEFYHTVFAENLR